MNLAAPVDWLLNVGTTPYWPELRAETSTLCVLQHGLIRSACSLVRLQRTLLRHGYAVLNRSYPSVWDTIEAHAERLHASLERRLFRDGTAAQPPRLCYLGHSMGGLVVRACLARADARAADTCLFLATPQRGAALARVRHSFPPLRIVLGRNAPRQLIPGDPLYARLPAVTARRIGVIYGRRGDGRGWNRHLAGDDDGTVAVAEALLPEAHDQIGLRYGHTRITTAPAVLRQVLVFLRHGRFEHAD
ncbi:MAG: hypothetical protein U1F36_05075 [Planctomycetota bacterium]